MAHSFGAGFPMEKATRWFRDHNKKMHKHEVDMPNAIAHYNKHMGVDKMDHCIALHPCKFKVK